MAFCLCRRSFQFSTLRSVVKNSHMWNSARGKSVQISGIPQSSLLDEKLSINIENLPPKTELQFCLHMTNELNLNFQSSVSYLSDENGCLSLERDQPLDNENGLYKDSMGLFRDLKPLPGSNQRFWSADVTKPFNCHLKIVQNSNQKVLKEIDFQRVYMGPGVKREVVSKGRLQGRLFLPSESRIEKPVVPVITLHGGIMKKEPVQEVAALLASHGIPALALAYFGLEGLPKKSFEEVRN